MVSRSTSASFYISQVPEDTLDLLKLEKGMNFEAQLLLNCLLLGIQKCATDRYYNRFTQNHVWQDGSNQNIDEWSIINSHAVELQHLHGIRDSNCEELSPAPAGKQAARCQLGLDKARRCDWSVQNLVFGCQNCIILYFINIIKHILYININIYHNMIY